MLEEEKTGRKNEKTNGRNKEKTNLKQQQAKARQKATLKIK